MKRLSLLLTGFLLSSITLGQATLMHSYTFEEGTYDATTVNDQVGSVNGTLSGSMISIADGRCTVSGATSNTDGYISFDGVALALSTYSAITLEAMVETGELLNTSYTMLAYFGATTQGQNCFWIQPTMGGNETRIEAANTTDRITAALSDYEVDDGEKHHIAAILSSTALTYYLDGKVIAETSTGGNDYISTLGTEIAQLFKGPDNWPDPNYNCHLDEFNIYNGALSPLEISMLSNKYLDPPSFSRLLLLTENLYYIPSEDFLFNQPTDTVLILQSFLNDSIEVSSISNINPVFSLSRHSASLAPRDSIHLVYSFHPEQTGFYNDTIIIESDYPDLPVQKIPVKALYYADVPCGVITQNTSWKKENSPYYVDCNLTIASGVTLNIEPGVIVLIDNMSSLFIDGSLIANGLPDDSIVFKSFDEESFQAIIGRNGNSISLSNFRIENGINGLDVNGMDVDLKNGIIQYCETGLHISGSGSFSLDSLTIQNNYHGAVLDNWSEGSVDNCQFLNNNRGAYMLGEISVQNSLFLNNNAGLDLKGVSLGTVIAHNVFKNNELGVKAQDCANFYDNVITQNNNGAECSGVILWQNQINENSNFGLRAETSNVRFNTISSNDTIGIWSSNSIIKSNLVTNNLGHGIYCQHNDSILENTIIGNGGDGIYVEQSPTVILYNQIKENQGNGIQTVGLPLVNYNNINSNQYFGLKAFGTPSSSLDAKNNYWGSMDSTDMAQMIYDYFDNGTSCKVIFMPFLQDEIDVGNIDFASNVSVCEGDEIPPLMATGQNINWYSDSEYSELLYTGNVYQTGETVFGIHTFYITQTLDNGTILHDTASLYISSYPVINSIEKTNESGCATSDGTITIDAADSYPLEYSIDGGKSYYENAGLFSGVGNGNYPVMVTNIVGCVTSGNLVEITSEGNIPPAPQVSGNITYCLGDQMEDLTATALSGGSLSWYDEPGLSNLVATGPIYSLPDTILTTTYYVTEKVGDCESSSNHVTIKILDTTPFEEQEICLVTADLYTGNNVVTWEKSTGHGIASFNIYREGNLIGSMLFGEESVFEDTVVNPETRPYLYFISSVDSCGNESGMSSFHKPLFLQYVSSTQGVNLEWDEYQVQNGSIDFESYTLFRGTDSTDLTPLEENIPTQITVYTDNDTKTKEKKYYYRIAGKLQTGCAPSIKKKTVLTDYLYSMSNITDNKFGTGVAISETKTIDLYPNPTTSFLNLRMDSKISGVIEIYNITGDLLSVDTISSISENIDLTPYPKGIYFVTVKSDDWVRTEKVVKF